MQEEGWMVILNLVSNCLQEASNLLIPTHQHSSLPFVQLLPGLIGYFHLQHKDLVRTSERNCRQNTSGWVFRFLPQRLEISAFIIHSFPRPWLHSCEIPNQRFFVGPPILVFEVSGQYLRGFHSCYSRSYSPFRPPSATFFHLLGRPGHYRFLYYIKGTRPRHPPLNADTLDRPIPWHQ